MELSEKNILVVGLGKTGAATARFLNRGGACVTVSDMSRESGLGAVAAEMRRIGIQLELGGHTRRTFEDADLIVMSPGVPHTLPPVQSAIRKGVPVIGEIELASRFITAPVIAVTGTNGKTTTTTLLGEMLKDSGFKVFVGGNIGNPLIEYADTEQTADRVVVEVSSFQLDTIQQFRPHVGVLLNITADHLDRYPDVDAYAASKGKVFNNQMQDDFAIVNGTDPYIRKMIGRISSTVCFFDGGTQSDRCAVIGDRQISLQWGKSFCPTLDLSASMLPGRHNAENIAAAALAALAAGGTLPGIQSAVNRFKGLPHRIEYVGTVNEVNYYNDSKATNVDAVARALTCFDRGVVLIMGGRDKGGSYEALRGPIRQRVRQLIVMGEAAAAIRSTFEALVAIRQASTMEEAVLMAARATEPDDTVLLSPACSSFDMYGSYGERGEDFRRSVRKLKLDS